MVVVAEAGLLAAEVDVEAGLPAKGVEAVQASVQMLISPHTARRLLRRRWHRVALLRFSASMAWALLRCLARSGCLLSSTSR